MNLEIIDKWLDNEFGVSYTRLEELHDFVIEQDLKHQEKADKEIDRLNNIIKEVREYCNDDNNFEILTDFDTFENHNRIGKDILEILDKGVDKE